MGKGERSWTRNLLLEKSNRTILRFIRFAKSNSIFWVGNLGAKGKKACGTLIRKMKELR